MAYYVALGNCPGDRPCVVDISDGRADQANFVRFRSMCAFHQQMTSTRVPDQVFDVLLQSCRTREAARAAAKAELGLDKDHPGVPFRVNADGSFTVLTDRAGLDWVRPDGSPGPVPNITTADRNRARSRANAAASAVRRPLGVPTVTVD